MYKNLKRVCIRIKWRRMEHALHAGEKPSQSHTRVGPTVFIN